MTKNNKSDSVQLRIVEANNEDVNRGIVRVNPFLFSAISLKENDFVALINANIKAKTVALLKPCFLKDLPPTEIKVCGALRRNLKAELKDEIIVRKTSVVPAKIVFFTCLNKKVDVKNSDLLAQKLLNRVVSIRDIVSFNSPKGRIDLQVIEYSPKEAEAVLIGKDARTEFISDINAEN